MKRNVESVIGEPTVLRLISRVLAQIGLRGIASAVTITIFMSGLAIGMPASPAQGATGVGSRSQRSSTRASSDATTVKTHAQAKLSGPGHRTPPDPASDGGGEPPAGGRTTGSGYDNGARPWQVAVSDVTGDKWPDIVTGNGDDDNVSTLKNLVSGGAHTGFSQPATSSSVGVNTSRIAMGDLNGDSNADIVAINGSATVQILLGDGAGNFTASSSYTLPTTAASAVALYDMNGDGNLDVVTGGAMWDPLWDTKVSVALGAGDGTFGTPTEYTDNDHCLGCGFGTSGIAVADINGDGHPDVLETVLQQHADDNDGHLLVHLGMGAGSLGSVIAADPSTGLAGVHTTDGTTLVVGDFSGHGGVDVVTVANSISCGLGNNDCDRGVEYMASNGDGTYKTTFIQDQALQTGGNDYGGPEGIAMADMNSDGKPDILTADSGSVGGTGGFSVYLNLGGGSLAAPMFIPTPQFWPAGIALGDVNGDGKADVILDNNRAVGPPDIPSNVEVLLNGIDFTTAGKACTSGGTNPPQVAVILMEGVDSVSPNDVYDPSEVSSYCYSPDGTFPPSLQLLMDQYNPPELHGLASMTDTLAEHGGVVFLPWSFKGVWVSADGSTVHVNASNPADADRTPIATDAATLAQEVASVHEAWPDTKIVVLAHSLGGLIAEQYWESYWRGHHNGVARIIALDAPINGIKLAGDCALPGSGYLSDLCNKFSPDVYNFLKSLWISMVWHDSAISANDQDGAFLPVGTEGDFAYNQANGGSDTLLSQLLFQCDGWPIETCTPLPPAFLSPCPSEDHTEVKACPGVIDYVDAAVFGSGAESSYPQRTERTSPAPDLTITPRTSSSLSRRGRDPLRRLVVGRPWAQPASAAVARGALLTLNGRDLGTIPGVVRFSTLHGGFAASSIIAWDNTSIQTRVPTSSVSGPIALFDGSDEAVPVGPVAVLSKSNGVDQLRAPTRLRAQGRTAHLTVKALSNGRPTENRRIVLFDGYRDRRSQTNRHGIATFALRGLGRQRYVVHSGTKSTSVLVTWPPRKAYRVRLRMKPKLPLSGGRVQGTIRVRTRNGRAASYVPVTFSVQGIRGLLVPPTHQRTDRLGRVMFFFRQPHHGSEVVTATAGASSVHLLFPRAGG
jgi:hypothetical protein